MTLTVRVTPRASKPGITTDADGTLKVRLQSPPVDGAANEELVRLLASHFGIPRRQVELCAGQAGRTKRVRLLGVSEADVRALLPG